MQPVVSVGVGDAVGTPWGRGELVRSRGDGVSVVRLDWGAVVCMPGRVAAAREIKRDTSPMSLELARVVNEGVAAAKPADVRISLTSAQMGPWTSLHGDTCAATVSYTTTAGKMAAKIVVETLNRSDIADKLDGSRRQVRLALEQTRKYAVSDDGSAIAIIACQRPCVQRNVFEVGRASRGGRLVEDKCIVDCTNSPALVLKVSPSSRSTLLRSVADAERLLPGLSNRREAALAAVEGGTPCWEGEALNVPGGYTWLPMPCKDCTAWITRIRRTRTKLQAWRDGAGSGLMFQSYCPVTADLCTLQARGSCAFPRYCNADGKPRDSVQMPRGREDGRPLWFHRSIDWAFPPRPRSLAQQAKEADAQKKAAAAEAKKKSKSRAKKATPKRSASTSMLNYGNYVRARYAELRTSTRGRDENARIMRQIGQEWREKTGGPGGGSARARG